MADIKFVPYEQGLVKSDYIVNPDIKAYDLASDLINPTLLSHNFNLGPGNFYKPILFINLEFILF